MPKPPVLMYHGFGTRPPGADPFCLFTPVADFEGQVRFLAERMTPLDLDGYLDGLRRGRWPRRSVLVTIDDGFASTLHCAAPILARHGVPAVLFVPPGRLAGTSGWMDDTPGEALLTAEELRWLPAFGIAVQVHGMLHRRLPGLDPDELATEVAGSRRVLSEITGTQPARTFAYPEGRFDPVVVEAARAAGYEAAFSVEDGGAGSFSITRRPINPLDTLRTFQLKMIPGFEARFRRHLTDALGKARGGQRGGAARQDRTVQPAGGAVRVRANGRS